MTIPVRDSLSNENEHIEAAAKVIGTGRHRPDVFSAIYYGKRRVKSVSALMAATSLSRVRVLQEGGRLAKRGIVIQVKVDGEVGYEKIDFFDAHKAKVLKLASSPDELAVYPTKRKPARANSIVVNIALSRERARIRTVTIDDIDSFRKIRGIQPSGNLPTTISEKRFKEGVQKILQQPGEFKDWGGEKNDLYSTRLRVGGSRRLVAFGFKGPGMTGKLTPGKLGKNTDQIQRLFESAAQVFLIQYWREIDESVVKQMEQLAIAKSVMTGQEIFYGIIDGQDSKRLLDAYVAQFNGSLNT